MWYCKIHDSEFTSRPKQMVLLLHKDRAKCTTSCAAQGLFPQHEVYFPMSFSFFIKEKKKNNKKPCSIMAANICICAHFQHSLSKSSMLLFICILYVYHSCCHCICPFSGITHTWMKWKQICSPWLFHSPLAWLATSDAWDPQTCRSW